MKFENPYVVLEGCWLHAPTTHPAMATFVAAIPWAPMVDYAADHAAAIVVYAGKLWQCARTHTSSGAFDESAWVQLEDASRLSVVGAPSDGRISPDIRFLWRANMSAVSIEIVGERAASVEIATRDSEAVLGKEPPRSGSALLVRDSNTAPRLLIAAAHEDPSSLAERRWTWRAFDGGLPRAMQAGLIGDGVADDSEAAQAFVDANKGRTVLFDAGRRFLLGGVTLQGPSYNGTCLVFEGEAVVKPATFESKGLFQNACWTALAFQECDRCSVEGNFHGNRESQPDREHIYCVTLAGVTRFEIPNMQVREIRGDGVYVSQAQLTSSSVNSNGIRIGRIEGVNSENDGRNLVSIISGDNIKIGSLKSRRVGGVINGVREPGGFDIEPDHDYQSCKNIFVDSVDVITAGFTGLAILGRRSANATRNVRIRSAKVVNTSLPDANDAIANPTMTRTHTLAVVDAADVVIDWFRGAFANAYGDAVVVSNSKYVSISGEATHVREGARIGNDIYDNGPDATGVVNSLIDLRVSDISRFGFRTGFLANTTISGLATGPVGGHFPGGVFAVLAMGGFTQNSVTYSVDVPHHDDWTRAYRNDISFPCSFFRSKIADARFGYGWMSYQQMKDMPILVVDCEGYTDSPMGKPTNGPHVVGQFIRNRNAGPGQPKGWRCVASGVPGVWVDET